MLAQEVLQFSLLPAVCLLAGGLVASVSTPGLRLTSATQHFAAGVVFAAVAIELIPMISHQKDPIAITIGFLLGIGLMILVKHFTEHGNDHADNDLNDVENHDRSLPMSMIIAVAIDLFIDGALIGIAFKAGAKNGILIAVALAIEIFFLGLSTASTIAKRGFGRLTNTIIILSMTPIVVFGALLSVHVIILLPASWMSGVLSFGVSALLYLVTEELLVEAHEVAETPMITAAFFIGFLCIFLLDTQF